MRRVTDGNGADSTTATKAWLASHNAIALATLYLIGEPDDPYALWLTDWEAPLVWSRWGTFQPTAIKRGKVTSQFGLTVSSLPVEWSPPVGNFTPILSSTSPYQQVRLGWFNNRMLRAWTVYMPTPGDANTFGCSELFGGLIGRALYERGKISFTVNSLLAAVDQMVPGAVIELSNTLAGNRGATPPPGMTQLPQFNVIAGSTALALIADAISPTAHQIFSTNLLRYGFIVFNSPSGNTLGRFWSSIASWSTAAVGPN